MNKKENELSKADREKIRVEVIEHGNIERCAIENCVNESVVRRIVGVEMR